MKAEGCVDQYLNIEMIPNGKRLNFKVVDRHEIYILLFISV
jgi:hypothetical protein